MRRRRTGRRSWITRAGRLAMAGFVAGVAVALVWRREVPAAVRRADIGPGEA